MRTRVPRRVPRLVVLLGLVGALLAACAQTVVATDTATGADTITFGVTVPITGVDTVEGQYSLDGYTFAINTINQHGGIVIGHRHYRVDLRYYDDQSQPQQVTELYNQLITKDGVNFLLGPYSSLLTAAAVPVAEQLGVPMVAAHGAADSSYIANNKWVYSIVSPAQNYLLGILDVVLAKDPRIATVALLGSDEPYSHEVLDGAAHYAQQHGLRVVSQQYYPLVPEDLSAQLRAIERMHPDVVLAAGHLQDAILITRQAHDLCLAPKAMGFSVGPSLPDFRANLGAEGDYIFGATQWTSALRYNGDDFWRTPAAFASAFKLAYPGYASVPYQVAESAAALIAYQRAFENAGTLDSVAVAAALSKLDMLTFYGRIKFDSRGINVYKPMAVVQLQPDGHTYTVYPRTVAQRPALYPMPHAACS